MKKTNIFVSIGVLALVTVIFRTTFAINQNRSMRMNKHGGTFSKCKGSSIDGPDKFCKRNDNFVTYEVRGPVRNKCDRVNFDWDGPVKKVWKEEPFKLILELDKSQDFTGKLEVTAESKNVSGAEIVNCECGTAKKETDLFELSLTKQDVDDSESSSSSNSTDDGRVCPKDEFKLKGKIVGLEQKNSKEIKMRFRCQGTEWKSDSAIPGNDAVVKYEYGDVNFNGSDNFKSKVTPESFSCREIKTIDASLVESDITFGEAGKDINIPKRIRDNLKSTINKTPLLEAKEINASLSTKYGNADCCVNGNINKDGVTVEEFTGKADVTVGEIAAFGYSHEVDKSFKGLGSVELEGDLTLAKGEVAIGINGKVGVRKSKCGSDCGYASIGGQSTLKVGPSAKVAACYDISYFDVSSCGSLGATPRIEVGIKGEVLYNSRTSCDRWDWAIGPTTPKGIIKIFGGSKGIKISADIEGVDEVGNVTVTPISESN